MTHFRCLQEGILFNAVLHDAPSFVLLINCDSCSPRGGERILYNTKIIIYQRAFGIYVCNAIFLTCSQVPGLLFLCKVHKAAKMYAVTTG